MSRNARNDPRASTASQPSMPASSSAVASTSGNARIARILVTELLPDPPGVPSELRFTAYHLRVRWTDGTEGDLYTWEDAHEGEYEVCATLDELVVVIMDFFESLAIDAATQEDD